MMKRAWRLEKIKYYPKVLLVGNEPLNFVQGYGITISNLFKTWPVDKLMCVYNKDIAPDFTICKTQIKIDDLSKAREKIEERRMPRKIGINRIDKLLKRLISILFMRDTFEIGRFKRYFIHNALQRTLIDFKPDIIFCSVTSLKEIYVIVDVYKLLNAPIVLFIVDDWIDNVSISTDIINSYLALKTRKKLSWLINQATLCLGIGNDMCLEYGKRYGVEFIPFQNCPESLMWLRHGRKDWNVSVPFLFIFTGAVYHSCNIESILDFAHAIDSLNSSNKGSYLFEIHTQSNLVFELSQVFANYEGCFVKSIKSDQQYMAKLYGSADALILPFDFNDKAKRASRFSMPTKLPVYLLSGSPIFAYGPSSTVSIKYVEDNKCAFCVMDKVTVEELSKKIELFRNNTLLRESIAKQAQKMGKQLSAEVVRPKFLKQLNLIR